MVVLEGEAGDAKQIPTEETEKEEAKPPTLLSIEILRLTKDAQQQHGLRHGDYQRYRGYCSRRLRRLRKVLKIPQGDRRHYRRRDVTTTHLTGNNAESRLLCVPLLQAERAWAHAMQLRQEANTEPRKKFHLVSRLKKASAHAQTLLQLCEQSGVCDARTQLEAGAYAAWLGGVLLLELQQWRAAAESLQRASLVLDKLCAAVPIHERHVYKQKVSISVAGGGDVTAGAAAVEQRACIHERHVYKQKVSISVAGDVTAGAAAVEQRACIHERHVYKQKVSISVAGDVTAGAAAVEQRACIHERHVYKQKVSISVAGDVTAGAAAVEQRACIHERHVYKQKVSISVAGDVTAGAAAVEQRACIHERHVYKQKVSISVAGDVTAGAAAVEQRACIHERHVYKQKVSISVAGDVTAGAAAGAESLHTRATRLQAEGEYIGGWGCYCWSCSSGAESLHTRATRLQAEGEYIGGWGCYCWSCSSGAESLHTRATRLQAEVEQRACIHERHVYKQKVSISVAGDVTAGAAAVEQRACIHERHVYKQKVSISVAGDVTAGAAAVEQRACIHERHVYKQKVSISVAGDVTAGAAAVEQRACIHERHVYKQKVSISVAGDVTAELQEQRACIHERHVYKQKVSISVAGDVTAGAAAGAESLHTRATRLQAEGEYIGGWGCYCWSCSSGAESLHTRATRLQAEGEYIGGWGGGGDVTAGAAAVEQRACIHERHVYKQKVEELKPSLRYCAYNIGDQSAAGDLVAMRGQGLIENLDKLMAQAKHSDQYNIGDLVAMRGQGLIENLDKLMAQAKESRSGAMSEVEWRGRRVSVRPEKVRLFLIALQDLDKSVADADDAQAKIDVLENILMDCKDAIAAIKDEIKTDPKLKASAEHQDSDINYLLSYLQYVRLMRTVARNNLLVTQAEEARRNAQLLDGKKVRPHDLARLTEIILQNYTELQQLPGFEEDAAYQKEIEDQAKAYRAFRCFYIAQVLTGLRRFREALAMLERCATYANDAKACKLSPELTTKLTTLQKDVESCKFEVHADSVLEDDEENDEEGRPTRQYRDKKPLVDRLDEYREDTQLLTKNPNVYRIPPPMEAIPCKPLFFDLACNFVEFPSLEDKLGADKKQPAGITGLVKGFLGWGKGGQ
ncbi:RNA-binding signal recognition particle 68 domain-containing protein [Phthorimaea operculella]|nr:RNA-binding signal recognition particle 68 domain-containing protein [Phthorimaea operculella]